MAGLMKRFMAVRCEHCPACRYARNHPENWFGRLMAWHGSWCPFWKARQEIYGDQRRTRDALDQTGAL
ncbi:MAG: hypothetical protein WC728_05210 [Elusimicrobiota bacterium]